MAVSRVVDLRCCVCNSHWTRALSASELALSNSAPRRCGCCTWRIWSCRRSEHSRTNSRNRQSTLACVGACDLADPSRAAGVCGCVGCSSWACPSATEQQLTPCLAVWPNVVWRFFSWRCTCVTRRNRFLRWRRCRTGGRRFRSWSTRSDPSCCGPRRRRIGPGCLARAVGSRRGWPCGW